MNAVGFPLLRCHLPAAARRAAHHAGARDDAVVASNARWTALWTSLITFGLSLILWFRFDKSTADFQFVEEVSWLPEFGISYAMGVDGISVLFVLLSTALTPICILAPGTACRRACASTWSPSSSGDDDGRHVLRPGLRAVLRLLRAVLIPMFLIIASGAARGGSTRRSSSSCYTLLGSVLMLTGRHRRVVQRRHHDIHELAGPGDLPSRARPGCSSPSSPPSR
jgi:NADH-quinone oxidoreductase subunit M